MCFRLGNYDFKKQTFRSDNGCGGEIYEKDEIIARANFIDEDSGELCEGIIVSEL